MSSLSHSSEKADTIAVSSRALPEQVMLASGLVLAALAIFLSQRFDEPLFRAIYGATDARTAFLW